MAYRTADLPTHVADIRFFAIHNRPQEPFSLNCSAMTASEPEGDARITHLCPIRGS